MTDVPTTRMKIALIGFGTVGLGWAATYLANGYRVWAYDPGADPTARAEEFLTSTWPALTALGVAKDHRAPLDRLRIVSEPAEAIDGAAVVHENGPEDVATKRSIFSLVEAHADKDAIIASSSGGLPPSTLQANMRYPERMLIAHPFNPPHLVPLVEVIGGKATSGDVIDKMLIHLRSLGKHPIRVDKEVPGYLTNRLQFALLREAVHCFVEGIAPLESIEDAVRYGLAPRWLAMGSLTTLTLAGGQGGMARMLDSFGDAIDGWWRSLGTPHMTAGVKESLATAGQKIVAENSIDALIKARDEALVLILKTLSSIDERPHAER